jgi:hypothetical protein
MSEENTPAPTSSGWLDRRLDRKARKLELGRANDRAALRNKIERRVDKDELNSIRRAKLASAVRTAMISGPILAPMSVAWTGQAGFAMKVIGWDLPAALVYAAAYELTTTFCGWMYHEARKDGDSGLEYRLATWAFASGSAAQQWWHYSDHWSATPRSVTFASMTIIGLAVWELYARLIHRRELRRTKMRTTALPKLGLVRWVRFPRLSWSAWSAMVRAGIRDLDQAWSIAEQERTARRTGRTAWSRRRTSPDRVEVGGWTSSDATLDQLGPLPDYPVQRADQPPTPVQPDPDQSRVDLDQLIQPELPAGPTETTAPDDEHEFEPTEVEQLAIQYMVDNGITLNRRNVGDTVRKTFNTSINTARAGHLARWGRGQGGLRAVG